MIAQSKALRSRQIGTEGQIVSRMLAEYDASVRPPVRGCHTSSIYLPSTNSYIPPSPDDQPGFILCFLDSADHSAIVVITSLFINRVNWLDDYSAVRFKASRVLVCARL